MKVILLQDVAKIGHRFEIVDVPNGFAQNKLIPQKLATEATAENVKRVLARKEKLSSQSAAEEAAFGAAIEALGDASIAVTVPANENGHLFQALRTDRIAEVLKHAGIDIAASKIQVEAPIKTLGTHTVTLVSGSIAKEVVLEVNAE